MQKNIIYFIVENRFIKNIASRKSKKLINHSTLIKMNANIFLNRREQPPINFLHEYLGYIEFLQIIKKKSLQRTKYMKIQLKEKEKQRQVNMRRLNLMDNQENPN